MLPCIFSEEVVSQLSPGFPINTLFLGSVFARREAFIDSSRPVKVTFEDKMTVLLLGQKPYLQLTNNNHCAGISFSPVGSHYSAASTRVLSGDRTHLGSRARVLSPEEGCVLQ